MNKFSEFNVSYTPDNHEEILPEYWSCKFLLFQWESAFNDVINGIQPLPCRANLLYLELKKRKIIIPNTESHINLYPAHSRLYWAKMHNIVEEKIYSPIQKAKQMLLDDLDKQMDKIVYTNYLKKDRE